MDAYDRALRDRYFELRAAPEEAARAALWAELAEHERPALARLAGLELSPCPTARFRQLRFVEARHLPAELHEHFARPCPALPSLLGAFVDPHELGFHCFENIVCLDRLFEKLPPRALRCRYANERAPGVFSMRGHATTYLASRLDSLDELGLYLPPPNAGVRGGQRFIFHAAGLAKALTSAFSGFLPAHLREGLVGVNPVFRCNRFEPGDAPFTAHLDAPYADPARGHYSTHTVLLQLREGRGEGVLRFGDELSIDHVEAYQTFIFDQRRVHAGAPFDEGPKIFVRSELIYAREHLDHDPEVGGLFAKAIYLDTEQLFAPELAAQTHAAYERAAAAHWRLQHSVLVDERHREATVIRKTFRGHHFLTNGYDYWFSGRDGPSLPEAAALALLDVLNAKIDGRPFREQCTRDVLRGPAQHDEAWLSEQLASPSAPERSPIAALDPPTWFPKPEEPESMMAFPRPPGLSSNAFPEDWDATRYPRVIEAFTRAQEYAKQRILPAPIVALGQELFLVPEHFVVSGDQIHVLSRERLAPTHFAGAVYYTPWDFVVTEFWAEGLHPLVPPIPFHRHGALLHLRFDLFRNDWMVSSHVEPTPIPGVETDNDEAEPDTEPWLLDAGRQQKGGYGALRKLLDLEP